MMGSVAAVAVVVPLLGATVVMAAAPLLSRRVRDVVGIAVAAGTLALCAWLTTADRLVVSWMGGWAPVAGRAIGIPLAVDPIGAGVATLAAALTTAALVFSWRYFEEVGALYHVLMLLFLGGMVGFSLTGDLFNLFVFFELLTTAAYALTAYDIRRQGPLHGALNFAVTNTIGAFLMLHGIGLLYGRTGTLALAEVGRQLATTTPDTVMVAAFVLVSAGLFTKAAIIPFHFWLPDAHAVAPTPVSVLLSGVMIELGLYGWARVYWTVFAASVEVHEEALRLVIVGLGVGTALVAAVFTLAQHHLKRLLAFSSVSHSGLVLVGVGLLDGPALTGAGLYTLAHGAVKGALFLLAGVVLHRYGSVDELELHGRGRGERWVGALFALAALALAGLPPFGTTLGKQLVEESATHHGLGGLVMVTFVIAGALTAAAVLRAAGRIFLGWGSAQAATEAEHVDDEDRETEGDAAGVPRVMIAPVIALFAVALAVALAPSVGDTAEAGAERFVDHDRYAAAVMDGAVVAVAPVAPAPALTAKGAVVGGSAALLAVGVAAAALARSRFPQPVQAGGRWLSALLAPVRQLQSGHVGDYVAWMALGVAALAGAASAVLL